MKELEQIEAFGAFLDFLSNPAKYQDLLKEIKKATKDHRDIIEKQRQIKDVDKWRRQEEKRLNDYSNELISREQDFLERVDAEKKDIASQKSELAKARKKVNEREKDISEREKAVSDLEAQKVELKELQDKVRFSLESLKEKERLCDEREAKLRAALEGLK